MLPDLKKNADGSLTIYMQKNSPGADKDSNWLPAPDGPIYVVMRLYWPKKRRSMDRGSRPPYSKPSERAALHRKARAKTNLYFLGVGRKCSSRCQGQR
jgi:hypothetical protein